MKDQLSWKVGGHQGEGIESTGEILSTTARSTRQWMMI